MRHLDFRCDVEFERMVDREESLHVNINSCYAMRLQYYKSGVGLCVE